MPLAKTLCALTVAIVIGSVQSGAADFRGVYLHLAEFADERLSPAERETQMDAALDKIRDCGFTTVIPYANTSSGKAFWPSQMLPVAGAADFDALGLFVQKARIHGLKVMPAVCVLVSGEDTPLGVLASHPEWSVLGADGEPRGYICPTLPEARAWLVSLICEMADHVKPDGVLLDYLRFPNKKDVRLPRIDEVDPSRLQLWKEGALSTLMAEISAALRARHEGIKIGLYTWGPHVASNHPVAQRWPDWVRDGLIDLVNVSGYCYTENYGDRYMEEFGKRLRGAAELARQSGGRAKMSFALGFRTSHGAIKSHAEIGEYMAAARSAGCPGVAAFTWRSVEPYVDDIKREGYFGRPREDLVEHEDTPAGHSDSVSASEYERRLNEVLSLDRDMWGEELIAGGGASYENIKDYLQPLFYSTGLTNTSLGVHNILFANNGGEPPYAIAVADGSRIAAGGYASDNDIQFFVGDGEERYGSALDRLVGPELGDGYCPILQTAYTDAAGAKYEQEAFGSWRQGGDPTAFIRFSSPGKGARIRVKASNTAAGTLATSRASDADSSFSLDSPLYIVWSPNGTLHEKFRSDSALYFDVRRGLVEYWDWPPLFNLPEKVVMNCQRNLLIQNLMLRWRYSLGSVVYHDSYFQPESSDAMSLLAMYGFADEAREGLEKLVGLSKGEAYYANWERGEKLSHGAEYFYLTRDAAFIEKLTPQYEEICRTLKAQMEKDPNGLLEKQRHCGDIETVSYCTFHQSVCWRGMRDMAHIWRLTGREDLADEFGAAAESLRKALMSAVDKSSTRLPDGTLFVPSMLLEEKEPIYAPITETRIGSYWNLCMPYAFASGLWPFDSKDAGDILGFMHNHGGTLLGLLRFNYYPVAVGSFRENGLPGYSTTGYDNVYLPSYQRFLAQRDEAERLVLSFYGKLAHGQTRGTFVSGEGDTVGVWPGLERRTMYGAVCSANNAAFLLPLRLMLIRESFDAQTGEPDALYLAHATPRQWLEDWKQISVANAPTCFGPVSYMINSDIDDGVVDVTLDVPERDRIPKLFFRLRVPGNRPIRSVTVGGEPFSTFVAETATLDLSGRSGKIELRVQFE